MPRKSASGHVKVKDTNDDTRGNPEISAIVGFDYDEKYQEIFESYYTYRGKENVARANLGYSLAKWEEIAKDPIVKAGFKSIKDYIIARLEALYIEKAEAGDGNAVKAVLAVHSDEWGDNAAKTDGAVVPKFDERGKATWMSHGKG